MKTKIIFVFCLFLRFFWNIFIICNQSIWVYTQSHTPIAQTPIDFFLFCTWFFDKPHNACIRNILHFSASECKRVRKREKLSEGEKETKIEITTKQKQLIKLLDKNRIVLIKWRYPCLCFFFFFFGYVRLFRTNRAHRTMFTSKKEQKIITMKLNNKHFRGS